MGQLPMEIWTLIGEKLSMEDLKAVGATGMYLHSAVMPLLQGCRLLETISRRSEIMSVALFLSVRSLNIRVHDAQNMTALHYAVLKGYEEMVRLLTGNPQHKTLLNFAEKGEGNTPIVTAVRYQRKAILQLLLDAGANVNAQNTFDETALFWAVKNQREDLVRTLLKHGADPQQSVRHGLTPLILAIMDRRLDLVTLLVEAGCDVQQPDARGSRPLSWAVISDDVAIAATLLSHSTLPPNLSTKGADRSPLAWAVMKGNLEMVRLLLRHSTNTDQQQPDRRPPLIWAVIHHDIPVAELLLQSGALVEEEDGSGQTALLWATLKGDTAMVELLLSYGAKTNDDRRLAQYYDY